MKIAVIGSGTMGLGIAQAFIMQDGYEVNICIEDSLDAEVEKKKFTDQVYRLVDKNKLTETKYKELIARLQVGSKQLAADCDLVVESVFERFDVKFSVLKELDEICGPDTIITSNTSSISIKKLEQAMKRPLVGMHFFNPAAIMKLVEVISGDKADESFIQKVMEIAEDIGKVPVAVKDNPGFIVNRILIPMINEAAGLLGDGIADAEGIDNAMKYGANLPMGPLAVGDLVGLDVCLAIMNVIYEETKDEKYKPHPYLEEMAAKKLLGKKTGKGFFNYE